MLKTKKSQVAYSVDIQNRFSVLSHETAPSASSIKFKVATIKAENFSSTEIVAPASKKPPPRVKYDNKEETKPKIPKNENSRVEEPKTYHRLESKRMRVTTTDQHEKKISQITEAVEQLTLNSEFRDESSKPRRNLEHKGYHSKAADKRIFDRGEHSNHIFGRGKRTEKRQGRGPHNWGDKMEATEESSNYSYSNDNSDFPVKSIQVIATPITAKSHFNAASSESIISEVQNNIVEEEKEQCLYSLDEYKAIRDKMRIRPKNIIPQEAIFEDRNRSIKVKQDLGKSKVDSRIINFDENVEDIGKRSYGGDRGTLRGNRRNREFRPKNFGSRGPREDGSGVSQEDSSRGPREYSSRGPREFSSRGPREYSSRGQRADGSRVKRDSSSREPQADGSNTEIRSSRYHQGESQEDPSRSIRTPRRTNNRRGGASSRGGERFTTGSSHGRHTRRNDEAGQTKTIYESSPRADFVLDMSEFPSLS